VNRLKERGRLTVEFYYYEMELGATALFAF